MVIKRWPMQNWLQLDEHLRGLGIKTLLFCDKPDSAQERAFTRAGSSAIPVFTQLDNVAGLLARCDLVVSVDTGLLHMAAALDIPWVGLFGPTNPEVTGPYNPKGGTSLVAPFQKESTCGGCWKHFKYEDDTCRTLPQGSCMQYLKESQVMAACADLLNRKRDLNLPPLYERSGPLIIPSMAAASATI
jgi:ADP-heptose:LPS heptosyltransferase